MVNGESPDPKGEVVLLPFGVEGFTIKKITFLRIS